MQYWQGRMDWSLDKDWVCETCGHNAGLEWGLVNGECRCNNCHTQYMMRVGKTILTIPRCMLKEEYKQPIKQAYAKYQIPWDEMTDAMIDEFMVCSPKSKD